MNAKVSLRDYVKLVYNACRAMPTIGLSQTKKFVAFGDDKDSSKTLDSFKIRGMSAPIQLRHSSLVDRDVFRCVFHNKYHRPPVKLGSSPNILDLGANIGFSAIDLKIQYPDARIIGVEMDLRNCEIASANVQSLENVQMLHRAVWYESTVIHYDANTDVDAFQIDLSKGSGESGKIAVPSITITEAIDLFENKYVDFIKLDIEGAENEVLTKNNDWLDSVSCMNIEIHDRNFFETAFRVLEKFGFTVKKDTNHWSSVLATKKRS
jgi:FkbM family methyltransferase